MSWVVPFTKRPLAPISHVGGKGYSLIRMTHEGLQVPPGFVLSVAFFEGWLRALRESAAWRAFEDAEPEARPSRCDDLKAVADGFTFDARQRELLAQALTPFEPEVLFAVRSSSPEEDLEGSSFAGGYETVLGVRRETLESAVRRAFASCLDARIVVYKQQHGFDALHPSIAVVVQQQIASEVAGVGFSINPITNDWDEAVFSSNWGLGETVVSGIASPDCYIVNKVSDEIVARELGAKETSMWLTPDGGTEERADPRHDTHTLSDTMITKLARTLRQVEAHYDAPMDIEWAFAGGTLHLLQARPVTTLIPLHPDMVTAPDAPRRLYLDVTISVQGVLEPLSVMATSVLREQFSAVTTHLFGHDITARVEDTIPLVRDGRIYINLSNILHLAHPDSVADFFEAMDPLAAATLRELDSARYRADSFSRADKVRGLVTKMPGIALNVLRGRLRPDAARAHVDAEIEAWREDIQAIMHDEPASLQEMNWRAGERTAQLIFEELMPMLGIARRSVSKLKAYFADAPEEARAHLEHIDQALPGNVTVEMSLALEALAQHLKPIEGLDAWTASDLRERLERREGLPEPFVTAWEAFLERYGHRAMMEIDIASPRYRDDPTMLLQQILQLAIDDDPAHSPRANFERGQAARRKAFEVLGDMLGEDGWLTRKRYTSFFHCIEALGGLRESHKFCLIYALDRLRDHILAEAYALVSRGRLDAIAEVFDLTLEDLEEAQQDRTLDLRRRAAERRAPHERLARVPELPRIIDSRGRVFRPPPPEARDGELVGQPISPGVVRGAVKVLRSPDEKPLLKGEILVARATDPGWTPLFVNASAIILEIGGVLQHGALVAREYGKPCVSGIQNVLELLHDGDVVEVDGAAGVVRLPERLAQDDAALNDPDSTR